MKSPTSLSAKQRLFVISSLVLGSILLSVAVGTSSRARSRQNGDLPVVKDNTGSFSLIGLEKIDRHFEARLQNISNKTITAYGTTVCDVPESSTDYTIGDYSVLPGAVVEISTATETLAANCTSATLPTIKIVAVVFDDRTYAGEFQWIKGILDDRRGEKIQLKRINRLLAKVSEWLDEKEPGAVEKLKTEIAALPIDEGKAPAVRSGLSGAKQRALYLLDELNQWHRKSLTTQSRNVIPTRSELAGITSLQGGIDKLIRLNEKWISRY